MASIGSIRRPERWSVPFSDDVTEDDVEWLLGQEPFAEIDEGAFRGKITLRGILQNDARIVPYDKGDIIMRQGDWGNSAFFLLSGSARVHLQSPGDRAIDGLERKKKPRKGLFATVAQLWRNPKEPEQRDISLYRADPRLGTRGSGRDTRIFLQDVSAVLHKTETTSLKPGQVFGELAALGRSPRSSTVFADQTCEVLEIRWQGLRDIMRRDNAIRNHIDKIFRERALRFFLQQQPLFSRFSKDEMSRLVREAQFESYGQYDWAGSFKKLAKHGMEEGLQHEPVIASEGDHPNGVLIIRGGVARLSQQYEQGHRTRSYLTPGHVYGYDEIVDGWLTSTPRPLKYSLRAIGITTVVVIPSQTIEDLLLQKMTRRSARIGKQETDKTVDQLSEAARMHPDLVEFFVQNRHVNGSATMLINLDRCTRCDDCVRACASAHENNPRFLRQGPVHHNIMVANACMHCDDPVCMIECPTGAIHRSFEEGEVVIDDRTCIGCSACANNCPYSAIRMVEVRHRGGSFIRDEETHLPIVKATKCDLCVDQWGGPACQRACPHDALVRINMGDVESLANWCNR